ncbi:NHL repeat-containing protein [Microbacterium rhizomatis]|uniref:SMP-30/Gluconolactonase/LRE-like region domain-containing protein n=1 Tax=Microbacterium rhizomatis TaxID=1631477 RepID=A0A5J5J8G5_9MICO|nr:NHL repeat-containing protein [Microbacterium rhizomatis]KAA9111305.1 hypothetical protein F6B43_06875 [Microbacterium rhizomatis]
MRFSVKLRMLSGATVAAIAGVVLVGGGWISGADQASAAAPPVYTYITDLSNDRVVKVAPDGAQVTVASGLSYPAGVAVDSSGDVYIADTGHDRVVKVAADGTQTSFGSGLHHPYGVAVDGSGMIYIADSDNGRVVKVAPDGSQTIVASGLSSPFFGVAVDPSGTVYVADTHNSRVLKVATDGSQSSVGSGLSAPSGVAVDGSGAVYIADMENPEIVKYAAGSGQTYVGSALGRPFGVAVDASGSVYVTDTDLLRVVKIAADGRQTTIGRGLSQPFGVAAGVSAPVEVTGVAPAAAPGVGYSFTYGRRGIPLPQLSVTSGSLPAGLALSADGVLSGTPTQAGSFAFTITASNGVDPDVSFPETLDVTAAPTLTGNPPGAVTGTAYSYPFTTTGTPTPTTSITAGSLPPGLTLSADGVLSGTPTQTGTFAFTLTASNGTEPDATLPLTLDVTAAPTLTGNPPGAVTGTAYSYPFTTTGTPNPTTSITAGSLPPGLTLSADGVLSGTPTQTGSFAFTLTASNGTEPDATLPLTLDVTAAPIIPGNTPVIPSGGLAATGSSGTPWPAITGGLLLTAIGAALFRGPLRRHKRTSR